MSQLRQQFAKRLKELRKLRGMTQDDLAAATGLSVSFIRSIEQGISTPSFDSLELISTSLQIEVQTMFDFD